MVWCCSTAPSPLGKTNPHNGDRMSAFDELLSYVVDRGVGASDAINPFWQHELRRLKALLEANKSPSMDEVVRALGYYDFRLEPGQKNRETSTWAEVMSALKTGGENTRQSEHAGSISCLSRHKHLDRYIDLLDQFGLVSNMPLARHYWYSFKLIEQMKRKNIEPPAVFLEVGAGGGQFAMMMCHYQAVGHYVIADLPEMLLNSMRTLSARFPHAHLHFGEVPEFSSGELNFWFLDTSDIQKVPDKSVDVMVNFNSLMEMDEGIRNFYIEQLYRSGRSGSIFYNVNRRQRTMTRQDGEEYDNHPLFYPYRSTDTVIEWEPDQIQQDNRSRQFQSPHGSFCISRMAIIE